MSVLLHVLLPVYPPTCLTVRFGGWRSSWGVSTNLWRACRRLRTRYWGSPGLPPTVNQTREAPPPDILLPPTTSNLWPFVAASALPPAAALCMTFNLMQTPNYTQHLSDIKLHSTPVRHHSTNDIGPTPNYAWHRSSTKLRMTPIRHQTTLNAGPTPNYARHQTTHNTSLTPNYAQHRSDTILHTSEFMMVHNWF